MAPPPQTTTVFVRFIPPSVNIRRHHLEDVFSQIGPIKKSSVILPAAAAAQHLNPSGIANRTDHDTTITTNAASIAASSYGFVKYTTELDAQRAAEKLNHSSLKISDTETVKLKVERASRSVTATTKTTTTGAAAASRKDTSVAGGRGGGRSHEGEKKKKEHLDDDDDDDVNNKGTAKSSRLLEQQRQQQDDGQKEEENNFVVDDVKKTNRLIVRNLSFYAKKNHIRTALESQFGPILDIHIPTVTTTTTNTNNNDEKASSSRTTATPTAKTAAPTHRGFCFVTFVHAQHAQDCLAAAEAAAAAASASADKSTAAPPILIAKRAVSIARALNKTEHQKQQQKKSTTTRDNSLQHVKGSVEPEPTSADKDEGDHADDSGDSSSSSNDDSDSDDKTKGSDDDNSSDSEEESSPSDDDKDTDDDNDDEASQDGKDHANKVNAVKDEKAVGEKRTLFLRNLPFDATRHDLFQLFYKFGFITGIYLVKDKETGIPKGTAFVSFRDAHAIERALQAAASTAAVSSSTTTEQGQGDEQQQHQADFSMVNSSSSIAGGLLLNGRRIFVNLAVDKETAFTLTLDQKNSQSTDTAKNDGAAAGTKDRRNLYLKGEGRVDNYTDDDGRESKAWDELPESDQLKRQRAWSEKNSKLRSPLFFINPTRLSIRNLAKDVNEVALKRLCVEALQRGLENTLVTVQDQIAHWKASGELSTRDILKRVESQPDDQDVIPKFDEENVRKFIPSVYLDCEIGKNKKEKISRGFGFVEFEHHAHALACLRELNNNTRYTQEYAIGGKHAVMTRTRQRKSSLSASKKSKRHQKSDGDDQQVKLPRLIVEFAVENIAKAKQQAEHRALQRANMMKQKRENREKSSGTDVSSKTKEKKKSRGQRQREKKRQCNEAGDDDNEDDDDANENSVATRKQQQQQQQHHANSRSENNKANHNAKVKKVKPPKRQKVDQDEVEFSKLVASYKSSFTADSSSNVANDGENQGKEKKRWFE